MSLPPDLADRLEYLASLRSSLREVHGALARQQREQPRRSEGSVAREVASLRSDLAGVNRSMEARREALIALRDRSSEIDELAATVADAAATTRASLARQAATAALPSIDGRARNSASVDVDAARSRMRARGVLLEAPGGRQRVSVVRPTPSMFDRLQQSRERWNIQPPPLRADDSAKLRPQPLTEDLPDVCSICLEKRRRGQQALTLQCGHAFHGRCILRWLEQSATCPICKEVVPSSAAEREIDQLAAHLETAHLEMAVPMRNAQPTWNGERPETVEARLAALGVDPLARIAQPLFRIDWSRPAVDRAEVERRQGVARHEINRRNTAVGRVRSELHRRVLL